MARAVALDASYASRLRSHKRIVEDDSEQEALDDSQLVPSHKRRRLEENEPKIIVHKRVPVMRAERPISAPARGRMGHKLEYLDTVNRTFKWGSRGFLMDDKECSADEINSFIQKLRRKTRDHIQLKFVIGNRKKTEKRCKNSYECPRCRKVFSRKYNLSRHVRLFKH